MPQQVEVVGEIRIGLLPGGRVIYSTQVPNRNAAIMMLEVTKMELFGKLTEAEAKAAESVIEHPGNFDPKSIPAPGQHSF